MSSQIWKLDPVGQKDFAGLYEMPYVSEKGDLNYQIGMAKRKFGIRNNAHECYIKFGRTLHYLDFIEMGR